MKLEHDSRELSIHQRDARAAVASSCSAPGKALLKRSRAMQSDPQPVINAAHLSSGLHCNSAQLTQDAVYCTPFSPQPWK